MPALAFLCVGVTLMGKLEGWIWSDAASYSLNTAGTLGYGDFSPRSRRGRTWAIPFIRLAVAASGDVLASIGASLVPRRQSKAFKTLLEREIEIGLVEVEEFDELHAQFDRLDVDGGGYLDKNDLRLMAQLRGVKRGSGFQFIGGINKHL